MKLLASLAIVLSLISCSKQATPEPQISFAEEHRPHQYYVEQAELWWSALERDFTSEDAWYNYYRACRNAQGTADWREDFVNESPNLRLGKDIVLLMEEHIPNSFVFHFVKGSTGGVDPSAGEDLKRAYQLNPDFSPVYPSMVTLANSTHDYNLRKEVNSRWHKRNEINPGLLSYAEDVLHSLDSGAVILTQHDNDTYPLWMLQDARGLRPDVSVINIDFLLLESYRAEIFNEFNIPAFQLPEIDVDDYRENWTNVVHHFLGSYMGERPLYIALTVSDEWYKGFVKDLRLEGLALHYNPKDEESSDEKNMEIVFERFHLNTLARYEPEARNRENTIAIQQNYLLPLKRALELTSDSEKAKSVQMAIDRLNSW